MEDKWMDKRLMFNEDAANYDKWRPRYCDELFLDIIRYSRLDTEKHVVEIGCGTGQATEPILKTGCSVTAIELGEKLALFAHTKFESYRKFKVFNVAFEDFKYEHDSVDLVYSATAFHWIPKEIGYPKCFEMLKKDGAIALFWNRPGKNDDLLDQKLQEIYSRYTAEGKFVGAGNQSGKKRAENKEERYALISNTIHNYGFIDLETHVYQQTRTFSAENYISLLDTYSDHISMLAKEKERLYDEIKTAINSFGGIIDITDTIDLYLARKP